MVELGLLVAGLVGVMLAADGVVEGAAGLARRWGLPELFVGLTICAFGTSAPELAVNLLASLEGRDGLVLGNVLGSNLFNTCAVLGLASLITPLPLRWSTRAFEIPFSLVTLALFLWMVADGALERLDGAFLLGGFVGFLVYLLSLASAAGEPADDTPQAGPWRLALGLLVLPVASRGVVLGASGLATRLGLSDAVIGATLVAAGTSLPELATSVTAARRGRGDLAVGNVIGSNLFNLLLVLGLSTVVAPIASVPVGAALQGLLLFVITGAIWGLVLGRPELKRSTGRWLLLGFALGLGLVVLGG